MQKDEGPRQHNNSGNFNIVPAGKVTEEETELKDW